jgi:integrating conjugative element protein (TIGR03758 family)
MTSDQLTLFQQSTGFGTDTLTLAIAGVGAVAFLTWGGWLAYGQLQLWQTGKISFYGLAVALVRVAVVMLLLGYLVR